VRDLSKLSPNDVAKSLDIASVSDGIEVILAGLPCQAFARIGRPKLGAVAADPEAYKKDPRATLYRRFLKYVEEFSPLAIVLENVPDILNHGGHNVPEEISRELTKAGYRCAYTLLNAANYGVPQLRERLYLVACHESLGCSPKFPSPTHKVEIPKGYANARSFALKHVGAETSHYVPSPIAFANLPGAISVEDAIGDLAPIKRVGLRFDKAPSRKLSLLSGYSKAGTEYCALMRNWHGHSSGPNVQGHVVRHTPRDYALFATMAPGEQYPTMHKRALARFKRAVARRRKKGLVFADHSPAWRKLKAEMVPPYDPSKFPNKWRKLEADKPSCTLTAHIGKDTYSHIHYDSKQGRTISVREAARLQSFPDWYVFCGSMNTAFRQIGNAVPPLMASAIATAMLTSLRAALTQRTLAE
jgi:DNA (cytosine-5)-methyltransferase 1